jgi:hypothetical protein
MALPKERVGSVRRDRPDGLYSNVYQAVAAIWSAGVGEPPVLVPLVGRMDEEIEDVARGEVVDMELRLQCQRLCTSTASGADGQ